MYYNCVFVDVEIIPFYKQKNRQNTTFRCNQSENEFFEWRSKIKLKWPVIFVIRNISCLWAEFRTTIIAT